MVSKLSLTAIDLKYIKLILQACHILRTILVPLTTQNMNFATIKVLCD